MEDNEKAKELIGRERYQFVKVLADTLQGRAYLARDKNNVFSWVVIKETWKELVKQGKSRNGFRIAENHEQEKAILLYLSSLPVGPSNEGFARIIEHWEDEKCYYLAMEYCEGGELFNFILSNFTKGELKQIVDKALVRRQDCQTVPNEWSLCVKSIFRQMVEVVSWMHSHQVAHLDLSLENTMIASIEKYTVKIKMIDFGLARYFKVGEKFKGKVGKEYYMAPEVHAKKEYFPEKADIWCLGTMLFMMLVGKRLYDVADDSDPVFSLIIDGQLRNLLKHWKCLSLVPADALDILEKIFKPEKERITMQELRRHKYVGLLSGSTPATEMKSDK